MIDFLANLTGRGRKILAGSVTGVLILIAVVIVLGGDTKAPTAAAGSVASPLATLPGTPLTNGLPGAASSAPAAVTAGPATPGPVAPDVELPVTQADLQQGLVNALGFVRGLGTYSYQEPEGAYALRLEPYADARTYREFSLAAPAPSDLEPNKIRSAGEPTFNAVELIRADAVVFNISMTAQVEADGRIQETTTDWLITTSRGESWKVAQVTREEEDG